MTNLEIDRRLALAIGYAPQDVCAVSSEAVYVRRTRGDSPTQLSYSHWQRFDHQDTGTIYPIAEHYKLLPSWRWGDGGWKIQHFDGKGGEIKVVHANPRTCIALAVIEASERGLI